MNVDAGRRCADLLAALARTANVRLALQECGVSACWAYRRRRVDPDFDRRWRTAVAAGRRRLARAAARRAADVGAPTPAAAGQTVVGSSGKGTIRLERAKPCSFTDAKQARFLQALRATCNVRAAARSAGVSAHGAYSRFHADAAFRAEWLAALEDGRVHLEMALIAAARAAAEQPRGPEALPPDPGALAGMDAAAALQLLRLHRPVDARGRGRGQWVKPADPEATRAAILAKVAAVRAAREQEREQVRDRDA